MTSTSILYWTNLHNLQTSSDAVEMQTRMQKATFTVPDVVCEFSSKRAIMLSHQHKKKQLKKKETDNIIVNRALELL